jgi:ubiquinol-cytochrome c reductase cytochrome c1 subunit
MKKLTLVFLLALAPALAFGASSGAKLDYVKIDLNDKKSLQRGARIFVNYCLSCHSASYMRYNRIGEDLGISEELVQENLLFAADKVGDLMKAVMPKEEAMAAFGVVPPDLTLISRSRNAEWVYTYMRSFYRDDKAPSGWNNTVFPNVAMPHVLYEWQGQQRPVFVKDKDGVSRVKGFELERPGTMSKAEYDGAIRDLTNFLVYLGEPAKLERRHLGGYVIAFLLVLVGLSYLLKKSYWKEVK